MNRCGKNFRMSEGDRVKNESKVQQIFSKLSRTIKNYFFILDKVWAVAPGYLIILIIIALIGAILPVVPLFLMEQILNKLVNNTGEISEYYLLVMLLILAGFVNFLASFTSGVRTYLSNFTVGIVEKHINVSILEIATSTDLRYVDSKEYFVKLDNVRRALGRRWDSLVLAPVNAIAHTITLISLFVILGNYNIGLVIFLVIGITPNVLIQIRTRGVMNDFFISQLEENRKIGYLENMLTDRKYSKELRLFKTNHKYINIFKELLDVRHIKINKLRKKELILTSSASVLSFTSMAVCQIVIAFDIFMKHILIGQWQLYTGTISSISFNLGVLFNIIANSYEEELFSNVLNDFSSKTPMIDLLAGERYTGACPKLIELVDVGFCYPDSDTFVLRHVNLTIQNGEKVALVGLNGAGKTTLIKLITHLYKPTEGKILFDGIDTSRYAIGDLYKLFGVVFQDFSQYAFTLEENIAMSNIDNIGDKNQMNIASINSGIDELVDTLPYGYKTYITKDFDKNGIGGLSGGQWQRVAIARGFFNDAPIIIFDEPASNLDPLAEYEVYQKLITLSENKTTIIISHRLSSARMSDRIVFLDKGQIVESGTHDELIKKNSKYSQLFRLQAEQYNNLS